ncbi:enoyl-CoA hydratase-related protein [Amycolatopsis sp. GM8]|uniref:enoyl-CoA hydratase-related protein n=1 Tax=Amycolatopsis sp. GM8 TaxID=2896530 RepID=UPI001F001F38|nr:enoyl-CoA hydratase-related protein [Amycolatopsis sp. GM8]
MSEPEPATDPVLVQRRDHVMVITINRPAVRNAVNEAVCQGVGDAITEAERDDEVRAIVLTGAGDKAFCGGADLKAISRGERILPEGEQWQRWGLAGFVGRYIDKPTIAAVNGVALGGGAELALAADLVIAADNASFGLPEVKRGLFAAAGGAFRLVAQVPARIGLELLMTGEAIDADRALELGLVNRVVPAARVLGVAMELAAKIAANAPLAVRANKRIALGYSGGDRPHEARLWELTAKEMAVVSVSEDAKEGPRAFAEKRSPVFKGR